MHPEKTSSINNTEDMTTEPESWETLDLSDVEAVAMHPEKTSSIKNTEDIATEPETTEPTEIFLYGGHIATR